MFSNWRPIVGSFSFVNFIVVVVVVILMATYSATIREDFDYSDYVFFTRFFIELNKQKKKQTNLHSRKRGFFLASSRSLSHTLRASLHALELL